MKILYLGMGDGTSLDRANAYVRLGHDVTHIDPRKLLPRARWVDLLTWHVSDRVLAPIVHAQLIRRLAGRRFDFCHVDSGEWIDARTVRLLKQHCGTVINYNVDDPTGKRDSYRFQSYRLAVPEYDLVTVVREVNVDEVRSLGARRVLRVFRSADEVSHSPLQITPSDHQKWKCEALFLGTWMSGRDTFLMRLIKRGVPVTIQGARWHRAPAWSEIQSHWRGGHLEGQEYAKAIQCAQVNIGLLSSENRDLHTTRSLEVPALGGLLCAERTPEHLSLYKDGEEALFWDTAEECADLCRWAITNPKEAATIAARGHARFERNQMTNESVLKQIIQRARDDASP